MQVTRTSTNMKRLTNLYFEGVKEGKRFIEDLSSTVN